MANIMALIQEVRPMAGEKGGITKVAGQDFGKAAKALKSGAKEGTDRNERLAGLQKAAKMPHSGAVVSGTDWKDKVAGFAKDHGSNVAIGAAGALAAGYGVKKFLGRKKK